MAMGSLSETVSTRLTDADKQRLEAVVDEGQASLQTQNPEETLARIDRAIKEISTRERFADVAEGEVVDGA